MNPSDNKKLQQVLKYLENFNDSVDYSKVDFADDETNIVFAKSFITSTANIYLGGTTHSEDFKKACKDFHSDDNTLVNLLEFFVPSKLFENAVTMLLPDNTGKLEPGVEIKSKLFPPNILKHVYTNGEKDTDFDSLIATDLAGSPIARVLTSIKTAQNVNDGSKNSSNTENKSSFLCVGKGYEQLCSLLSTGNKLANNLTLESILSNLKKIASVTKVNNIAPFMKSGYEKVKNFKMFENIQFPSNTDMQNAYKNVFKGVWRGGSGTPLDIAQGVGIEIVYIIYCLITKPTTFLIGLGINMITSAIGIIIGFISVILGFVTSDGGLFYNGFVILFASIICMPIAIQTLKQNKLIDNNRLYKSIDRAYNFQDLLDNSPFKKIFAQHRTLRIDSAIGNVKDNVLNRAAKLGKDIYTTKYRKIMGDAELFSDSIIIIKNFQKFIGLSHENEQLTKENLNTIIQSDHFGTEDSHIFYLFTIKKPQTNGFSYKGFITKLGEIDKTFSTINNYDGSEQITNIIHFRMHVSKRFNNTESQNEEKIVFNKEGDDYKLKIGDTEYNYVILSKTDIEEILQQSIQNKNTSSNPTLLNDTLKTNLRQKETIPYSTLKIAFLKGIENKKVEITFDSGPGKYDGNRINNNILNEFVKKEEFDSVPDFLNHIIENTNDKDTPTKQALNKFAIDLLEKENKRGGKPKRKTRKNRNRKPKKSQKKRKSRKNRKSNRKKR